MNLNGRYRAATIDVSHEDRRVYKRDFPLAKHTDEFALSAPGCIFLFGEHQDVLGLAQIATAIDLRMTIAGRRREDGLLYLDLPDVEAKEEIDPQAESAPRGPGDCVRFVFRAVRERGAEFPHGYDFRLTSQIPINAGASSSSAFATVWASALCRAAGKLEQFSGAEIAQMAHNGEEHALGTEANANAHYVCAFGGIQYVDCSGQTTATPIDAQLGGLVLGHCPGQTEGAARLQTAKRQTLAGVAAMRDILSEFDLKTVPTDQIIPWLRELPDESAALLYANMRNRDMCRGAREMLESSRFDQDRLGELIDEQHALLRDYLRLSTDNVEAMVREAKNAGALGCKVNGTGGAVIAYAPEREKEVAEAIERAGGKAYVVHPSDGLRMEKGTFTGK